MERLPLHLVGKPARAVRIAVGIGHIGLDIKDRRSIHQIRPRHMEHRAQLRVIRNALQPHGGEAQGVGPEGGSGGEHPHALVATQPGRAHGGGPVLPDRLMKAPDQPDMAEPLQPPHRLPAPVLGAEHHGGPQICHQPALPGYAEFAGERAADMGNGLDGGQIPAAHGVMAHTRAGRPVAPSMRG